MTNQDLQTKLDREKYLRGYQNDCDNSGKMWYCEDCANCVNGYRCGITHDERIATFSCAKNARKLKKRGA